MLSSLNVGSEKMIAVSRNRWWRRGDFIPSRRRGMVSFLSFDTDDVTAMEARNDCPA
jgi:hypothetical protein